MYDDTDFSAHDGNREDQSIPMTGPAATGSTIGNKYEDKLNGCQADNVPSGHPQPAPAAPAPEPQPEVPAPAPVAEDDPNKRHTDLLNSALAYARMGWPVIPCHWIWEHVGEKRCSCNKADCDSPGKHPIGKLTPHGLKEATTDPETIRKWWEQYPVANIAVVTGEASGLAVLDLDIKEGKNGQVALEKWCYDNGVTLPETITQQTGSGGLHYLFRYPAGMDINGATDVLRNGTGIDVRGQNGYIMVEPSVNTGGQYNWIADNDPLNGATPADLPLKLLELIGGRKKASAPSGAGVAGAKWIVHEETVQEVIDALKSIPADNYQRWIDQKTGEERLGWIEIGHALKMMGLGERGFQIWDDWSQKSTKYAENPPGLMRNKWDSFKPDGRITHRSIFFEAQKYGWINPQSSAADGAGMMVDPETGEILEGVAGLESPQVDHLGIGAMQAKFQAKFKDVGRTYDDSEGAESIAANEKPKTSKTPEHLLSFPVPVLNEVKEYFEIFAKRAQSQISVQGVLAFMSALAGRIYATESMNTSTMYFLTIGETGIGKEYVRTGAVRLLRSAGLGKLVGPSGYNSPGALFSALHDSPTHLTMIDEFGRVLASVREGQHSPKSEAMRELVVLWSLVRSEWSTPGYSRVGRLDDDHTDMTVHCPAITMFGFGNQEDIYASLRPEDISNGFLNRMVVVEATEPQSRKKMPIDAMPPGHLVEWARRVRRMDGPVNGPGGTSVIGVDTGYGLAPSPVIVKFSDGASIILGGFDDEIDEKTEKKLYLEPRLARRFHENALRLSVVLAVAANPENPVITPEIARWAVDYVRHYGELFMQEAAARIAGSDFERVCNEVVRALRVAGENGLTESELGRKVSSYKALAANMRDLVIQTISREVFITTTELKPRSGRGKPRSVYIIR